MSIAPAPSITLTGYGGCYSSNFGTVSGSMPQPRRLRWQFPPHTDERAAIAQRIGTLGRSSARHVLTDRRKNN